MHVDLAPDHILFMCPWLVVVDSGRCMLIRLYFMPRMVVYWLGLSLIARRYVNFGDDKMN